MTIKYQEGTYKIDSKAWFKLWNHYHNPFGNWHEPMPYPEKHRQEAPKNEILAWLWWSIRNPLHNFTHFVLGDVPVGERYQWLPPKRDRKQYQWIVSTGWNQRGGFIGLKIRRQR